MTASTRQQWKSPNEFLFASIGMIVGLSNLLRFPFVVYNNGGLVFMMVYVLLMAVVAVPMTYLEIFLGQFSSCTGPGAFRGFPMAKGIAWSMLYVNLSSCVSYMNTVVHAFFYLFYSFSPTLPWISCNNSWSDANCFIMDYRIVPCFRINATLARKYASSNYTEKDALAVPSIGPGNSSVMVPASEYDAMRSTCLNATQTSTEQFLLCESFGVSEVIPTIISIILVKKILRLTSGIEEIGTLHWDVLLVIGIFWLAGFFTISKGIRSFAKVALCTSYTTYALLLVLLLSSVVQRGSIRGLAAYFSPDWEKLLDLMTWRAASQQLLFSMGLALGTLTCYGSYKRFQWPLSMKILTLTGADFLFSFFSGCMAFALHGHATVLYGMELGDVVTSGYDYAFVTYPESVKHFSHPQLWCIAFYALLCMLAFDGVAAFVEVAMSTLMDAYPSLQGRRLLCTASLCATLFTLSVPAATGGGMYMINLVDSVTYLDLVPWVALAEMILIVYGYGAMRLIEDMQFMTGDTPSTYLVVCWRYICPLALVIVCLGSVTTEKNQLLEYSYPAWTGIIRLAIILSCMVVIITQVMRTYGDNHNDIYSAMEPEPQYGPADPEILARYQATLAGHNVMPSGVKMSRQHSYHSGGVYRSWPPTTATSH